MMQQLELLPIENPCINVCQTDTRGYCSGCFRSRNERFDWAAMTPQQKRKVIELCKKRGQRRKAKAKKQQHQYQQNEKQIPIVALDDQGAPDTQNNEAAQPTSKQNETKHEPKHETIQDMGLDLFDL